jgi:hypothetical protein
VSGLLEGVQIVEDTSKNLSELIDRLQQGLADACVEFETRMISACPPAGSPVESRDDSPASDPVLDPASLGLVLDPIPLNPVMYSASLGPVLDPIALSLDPTLDPVVSLDSVLNPVVLDPALDPRPAPSHGAPPCAPIRESIQIPNPEPRWLRLRSRFGSHLRSRRQFGFRLESCPLGSRPRSPCFGSCPGSRQFGSRSGSCRLRSRLGPRSFGSRLGSPNFRR